MDLANIIQGSLDKLAEERKQKAENSGWIVQYCPCGHSREIGWNETALVAKAKARTHIDALIQHSADCPICNQKQVK